jgi:DNA-binding response OmpR family regulator
VRVSRKNKSQIRPDTSTLKGGSLRHKSSKIAAGAVVKRSSLDCCSQNILIATQDVRVASLIKEYLSTTGYGTQCEMNLDAALEMLMEKSIDFLIVDGEMPEKVLRNFVEAVARLKPALPMIVVGMSEHEAQSRTLSAFVSAFIEKPFGVSDILNTIKEVRARVPVDSFGNTHVN